MGSIAILGIFVADTAYRATRMPQMGETVFGKCFSLGPGGKGSNQAVAAGRLGADVTIITRLGNDEFAELAFKTWEKANVKSRVVLDPVAFTGAAFVFIDDKTGDNAIIVSPGAATQITVEELKNNEDVIATSDIFMTQLEQPVHIAEAGLKIAKVNGKTTILNPAPAVKLNNDIFQFCDFVTPNETEAEAITGIRVKTEKDADRASQVLASLGVKTPIITMGEQGAFLHGFGMIPAIKVGPTLETTGAGDAFNGGLATALSEGKSALEAVKFGCATASLCVTLSGTALSMPKRDAVDKILTS